MGAIKKKNKSKKPNVKLSRKELRKQKRQDKKVRRNEFYTNRKQPGQYVLNPAKDKIHEEPSISKKDKQNINNPVKKENVVEKSTGSNKVLTTEEIRRKEMREQKKIEKEMSKQRSKQLLEANIEEDYNIKQLEKQLKLNKRKSKSLPKSFAEDGLDYLLEICDPDSMESALKADKELNDVNDEFDEDFALMTGNEPVKETKKKTKKQDSEKSESESELEEFNKDFDSEEFNEDFDSEEDNEEGFGNENYSSDSENEDFYDKKEEESIEKSSKLNKKRKQNEPQKSTKKQKKNENEDKKDIKVKKKVNKIEKDPENDIESDFSEEEENSELLDDFDSENSENDSNDDLGKDFDNEIDIDEENRDSNNELTDNEELVHETRKGAAKINPDGTWEDIYGRLRSKNGAIVKEGQAKYVPPAIRAKLEAGSEDDKAHQEKINRIKRQLKGLLNRLAESNMHSIASQIEQMYMNNSRNDMNVTLTNLIMESLVGNVLTPERLLIEHIVLVTVLHANVGTEIGAHFLQTVIKKFDEYSKKNDEVENKMLDNVVNIIAQLYNFRMYDSKLVYEIIYKLSESFGEKDVECILHVLRNVGFGLRKDDPLALKNLILHLQKRAANVSEEVKDNSRVKFMLDILLAIKNNNVTKIPNYDTSYSEHLKKIMKSFIRKGNYVTQLNITLEDLLKADERGKWWVVGSAWTGKLAEKSENLTKVDHKSEGFSEKLLELARKQRMNTDTRRNIFCIIMSAEDYLDAFEKLLKLDLKNQQEREIINVILHCCLQEKVYNPYYSILARKFCEYDRRFQMTIKCSVWDKLKSLNDHSGSQISNLAKMLTYLFVEKGLPISTLKIMQFSELDKVTLRFMRQILLGVLLHNDTELCLGVFEKVAQSDKLKLFRESLRLFIHHFLLKNLKSGSIPEDQKSLLENRAKLVEKVLVGKEGKNRF